MCRESSDPIKRERPTDGRNPELVLFSVFLSPPSAFSLYRVGHPKTKGAARLHAFLFASLCAVYYDYYSYEEEEEEEHKRRTQKKKKRREKKREIYYI